MSKQTVWDSMLELSANLDCGQPTPEKVREKRMAAGLTQAQAALISGLGAQSRWAEYESGTRTPSWSVWAMFLLMTGQHPRASIRRKA